MGSLRGLICLTVIVDFRFGRPGDWRAGIIFARATGAVGPGLLPTACSVWWQRRWQGLAAQLCTLWGALHKKLRMRDSRSWNWRALIWETGVRVYDGSLYCVRLSTLIHWHYFFGIFADWVGYFWHWIFDTPFEKHSKGGVILSRSSQSWENLKFDTMLTLTKVGEDPQVAQHQIYHRIMCFRLPTPGGVSVKHQMSVCQASR